MRLDHKLPKGWRMAKLGEIVEVLRGLSYSSKEITERTVGMPMYNLKSVRKDGTFSLGSLKYFSSTPRDRDYVEAGDLLLALTDLTPTAEIIGLPARVESSDHACFSADLGKLIFDRSVVDPNYLYYLLRSPQYQFFIKRYAQGATVKHLDLHGLDLYEIYLPPLSTQHKIVGILVAADALRHKHRESDAKMKDLIPAIFVKMFGDPATNPRGWKVKKLGEVCKIRRGASPRPMGDPRYFGGNIPWIRIADIHRQGKYLRETEDHVTEEGAKRSVYLKEGSLIMAMAASIGTPCILKVNGCIHDGFVVFEEYEDVLDQEFFFYFIQAFNREFVRLAPQGTQKNLNTAIIKSVPMILSPMELQKEFARAARAVEEDFELHRKCDGRLEDLFSVLMYKVFRGELI